MFYFRGCIREIFKAKKYPLVSGENVDPMGILKNDTKVMLTRVLAVRFSLEAYRVNLSTRERRPVAFP
jgi:hypothetical protein